MSTPTIALVGDYSPEVIAHRAIPVALRLASESLGRAVDWEWIPTAELKNVAKDLAGYSGLWVVPRSPYAHMAGVLEAISWARIQPKPFLGTCGGFQHALIEIARSVAGVPLADHAETNPNGNALVVSALACSLVEKSGRVAFVEGSRLAHAYASSFAEEGYHCSYGVNPAYRDILERAGVWFTAFDETGEIRGAELVGHPFFVGTLFQPERAALAGAASPLVTAFVTAVIG